MPLARSHGKVPDVDWEALGLHSARTNRDLMAKLADRSPSWAIWYLGLLEHERTQPTRIIYEEDF